MSGDAVAHAGMDEGSSARASRAGDTIRWRSPSSSATRCARSLRRQPIGSLRRDVASSATDVIVTPGRPHATAHPNGARSLTTLIASPCFVIPPFTRMPIDAILRSSTHAPTNAADSSSRACATTPWSARAATIARSSVRTNGRMRPASTIGYATSWPGPW
jgi:hypothetical protein